jgi:hypothetical protein
MALLDGDRARIAIGPRKPQDARSLFRLHPSRHTRRGHS